MVECHHGDYSMRVTCSDHAPVVVERGAREEPFLRLDARPFDGETVGAEPEALQKCNIALVEVIMIASITRRFGKQAILHPFHEPKVACGIAAFDLVRCRRSPPEKSIREFVAHSL